MVERRTKFPERDPKSVQQATLCFLLKDDPGPQVLLAMKKRGFGEGLWNGAGGKQKNGETISQAVLREVQEEIGVIPAIPEQVGLIHFFFPKDPRLAGFNQDVHVYLVRRWVGGPQESEEMKPQWFYFKNIPYGKMWDDDKFWLPSVLAGKEIEAWFSFDERNKVVDSDIHEVNNLYVAKGGKISF